MALVKRQDEQSDYEYVPPDTGSSGDDYTYVPPAGGNYTDDQGTAHITVSPGPAPSAPAAAANDDPWYNGIGNFAREHLLKPGLSGGYGLLNNIDYYRFLTGNINAHQLAENWQRNTEAQVPLQPLPEEQRVIDMINKGLPSDPQD